MRQKRIVPFTVSSIDSLGQGVSKVMDKIVFIPKTAVGDEGEAEILSEKKGVAFARIEKLNQVSPHRIKPLCIHFDTCPSCHFLHLGYEQELQIKKENFEKLFRKLPLPPLQVIGAPQRLGYRNRMQLHFSLNSKLIGMRDPRTFQIIPIPECLIGLPEILNELKRLLKNDQWIKEAPTSEGHVEVYWQNSGLKVSWNRPYAEGGFTQVYEEMNQKLKDVLALEWQHNQPTELLDLFAGNGNLSQRLNHSRRLCVDVYNKLPGQDFLSQDLYADDALKKVTNEILRKGLNLESLLLDPPRSGLKNLNEWVAALNPQRIAYVSCDPHTMVRDLSSLNGYRLTKAFLIDFFPSTFHFESLIILERNR